MYMIMICYELECNLVVMQQNVIVCTHVQCSVVLYKLMVGRYTIWNNEVQCEVLYAVGRYVILSGRSVMLGKAGEALECGSWRPGAVPGARLPCYRGTGGRCPGAALLLLLLLLLHPQQPTTCPLFTLPTCSQAFCSRVAQLPSPSPAHNLPQPRLTLVRSHC